MAYRMVYYATLMWVGPGSGVMGGAVGVIPGSEMGGAQILELQNQGFTATSTVHVPGGVSTAGLGTGGTLTAGEITTITNAMAADISAQLNVASTLAQVNGWPQGNP